MFCPLLPRMYLAKEDLEIVWVPYDSAMGFIILTWFLLSHLTGIKSFTVNTLTGLGHQSSLALQTPAFDSSLLLSLISFSCLVLHIACMNPDMAGPGQMTCLVSYQSSPDPAIVKKQWELILSLYGSFILSLKQRVPDNCLESWQVGIEKGSIYESLSEWINMSSVVKIVEVHKISLESDLQFWRGPGEIPQLFRRNCCSYRGPGPDSQNPLLASKGNT